MAIVNHRHQVRRKVHVDEEAIGRERDRRAAYPALALVRSTWQVDVKPCRAERAAGYQKHKWISRRGRAWQHFVGLWRRRSCEDSDTTAASLSYHAQTRGLPV